MRRARLTVAFLSANLRPEVLFLSKRFLIHALDQGVDVIAHSFELITEGLILLLQVLLLHLSVAHAFNQRGRLLHLSKACFGLGQGLLDELVRVTFLDGV